MTAHPIHGNNAQFSTGTTQRFSHPPIALAADQAAHWRDHVNNCTHPAVLFDANGQLTNVNDALRVRMSDPVTMHGTNQPTAFVWQSVCDAAARIVVQQSKTASVTEVSEAFPLHQRCFVAVGRILRNSTGHAVGSAIELVDLSEQKKRLGSLITHPNGQAIDGSNGNTAAGRDPAAADSFQQWCERRDSARIKMTKLSRRETQVVALVADGLPNKSIAHELDISVKTIEKHRANATRKLGVGSTPQMVRIAVVADNKAAEVAPANTPTASTSGSTLPLHHFQR
ncbi:MAG: helix-turn-helix transcriptional regulator [Fuerstiella sp.]